MTDDLISRKALLVAYDQAHKGPPGGARKLIEEAPTVPAIDWIPFRSREMTEEEHEEFPANIAAMWDEPTPDDEQIILITDGTIAWTDKFLIDDDGGCYLGSGVDIEEGMAWAPCPKLYKPKGETA
jgi:hypothetical protein